MQGSVRAEGRGSNTHTASSSKHHYVDWRRVRAGELRHCSRVCSARKHAAFSQQVQAGSSLAM